MKDYIQLLKRQELLQNAELSIRNKQSSGHFTLITKLSCSDTAVQPRVCSSSAPQLPELGKPEKQERHWGHLLAELEPALPETHRSIYRALALPPPKENFVPAATVGIRPENHLSLAYTRLLEAFYPFPSSPEFNTCG